MSADNKKSARQKVSSVGNAWIVTESKSHPGLVYYFNTITGDAVWNLSESEIEKARLATKKLESQSGNKPTCPEPKDKPPADKIGNLFQIKYNQGQKLDSTMSQERQGGSQYSEQHEGINVNQTQKLPGAILSAIPMSDISAFDFNALNHQINAFNVITAPGVYNSNGWTIPRPQQFYITPSIPLVNSSPATLNVGYNQFVRDGQSCGSRFSPFESMKNERNRFMYGKKTAVRRGGYSNRYRPPLQTNDLRQRLSLKRRTNTMTIEDDNRETPNFKPIIKNATADVSSYIADIIDAVCSEKEKGKEEEGKGEYNTSEKQKQEIITNLNLKPLKSLFNNDDLESWYIVVDLNVLLEEFKFLNDVSHSDEQCTLLVPNDVVTELKDFISRSNNIPARRIYHALTQNIEGGRVQIGQQPNQDYGNSITDPILKTCFGLLEENVHVILITNNNELLRYKKFIKVNMFTVDELKTLLEYPTHKQFPKFNSQSLIKITIPGKKVPPAATIAKDTSQTNFVTKNAPHADDDIKETRQVENDCDLVSNITGNSQPQTKNTENSQPHSKTLKCTTDAAIQTETIYDNDGKSDSVNNQDFNKKVLKSPIQTETLYIDDAIPDSVNKGDNNTNVVNRSSKTNNTQESNQLGKRRKINLKRSISSNTGQNNSVQGNDKKPFRWRSKRCLSNQDPSNKPSNYVDNKTHDIALNANNYSKDAETGANEHLNETSNNEYEEDYSNLGEVLESRGSSVVCVSTRRENITIEETSTSGIISNTESNVDSEFLISKDNSDLRPYSDINDSVGTMQIDNETMEESLRTKCEEWVSRFIQIMEEVLAIILHKEPAFENNAMPPPWTLHEAAQCIRRYCNVASVKHAADKLSRVLFDLSDSMGKISVDITPSQYIELYNNGVFLLKEIKAITTHLEDIKVAENYLQALLSDIKNPQNFASELDIEPQDDSEIPDVLDESNVNSSSRDDVRSRDVQEKENDVLHSPKTPPEEPPPLQQPIKIIRNLDIKSTFFSSLKLQEVVHESPEPTEINEVCSNPDNTERNPIIFSSGNDNDEKSLVHCANTKNQPSIVRNFTLCAEFEEKLKNKLDVTSSLGDRYTENEIDYEYDSEYESDEFETSDNDFDQNDPNVTQISETSAINMLENIGASSPKSVDPLIITKSNNTFKSIVCIFLQEVKNAISEVKILCDKCYAELKEPQLSSLQRNELKSQIENARSHIFGLCISLESMLDRDPNAPTDNIHTALKNAGVDMLHVDENLLMEYWNTIANCKKNADVFLFSIQEIIAAFKTLSD